jgi:hypothetical protein
MDFDIPPGVLSSGLKRPRCEADHSPPSSAEVKNAWSCTTTPQYVFTQRYLVKHRDLNFALHIHNSENFSPKLPMV